MHARFCPLSLTHIRMQNAMIASNKSIKPDAFIARHKDFLLANIYCNLQYPGNVLLHKEEGSGSCYSFWFKISFPRLLSAKVILKSLRG